jgi:hypothetical protein
MNYKNLSKAELVEILENLKLVLEGQTVQKSDLFSDTSISQQNDLEVLIGTIPFLLSNKKIFEKNQDIAEFAKKLNIDIPSPEKKKREDIIGRIVSAITNFDNRMVAELNIAIKAIKKSDINKGKSNFFKDWENAIKQMKI